MLIQKAKAAYSEYPGTFWTLVGSAFIDRLGGALVFPFISLYVTQKFGVGMTEVGILFAIYAISSLFGNLLAGALADKLGRRTMILFSLVFSALSSLIMGFVNDMRLFYSLAALVGLLAESGGPAQQAMVADLLPERQRAEGFGILRVVFNLAVTIGPAIGGLLASRSYLFLFILDAITSVITAGIFFAVMPETKPQGDGSQPEQSVVQSLGGYRTVLRDGLFMAFIFVSILMVMVYVQMNSTLPVFLRDLRGVPPQGFGYILSLNAAMVVLFQFWITRRVAHRTPMAVLAFGTLFYAAGFAMYGFVSQYWLFLVAMAVITTGEMLISPVAQALVASFAPEDMRGRYMATYGFSWLVPTAIGPLVAGLIMDNLDPNWVWFGAGILSLIAACGYVLIHWGGKRALKTIGSTAFPT